MESGQLSSIRFEKIKIIKTVSVEEAEINFLLLFGVGIFEVNLLYMGCNDV